MARVFRCIGCDTAVPTQGALCPRCAAPRGNIDEPIEKPAPRFASPAVGVHVAGEVRADGMQFCVRCGDVLAARESRAGVVPMSPYHPGDLVERWRGAQAWKLRGEPTCEPKVF